MVRGVNRKIIEITNVEGGYFEKILFFVSDERGKEEDKVLEEQAEHYITDVCRLKYHRRFSGRFWLMAARLATAAGVGFAAAALLLP